MFKVTIEKQEPGKDKETAEFMLDEVDWDWNRDQVTYIVVGGEQIGTEQARGYLNLRGSHLIPHEIWADKEKAQVLPPSADKEA